MIGRRPLLLAGLLGVFASPATPAEVRIGRQGGAVRLMIGGKPVQIRGVGGDGSLELLKRIGGNAVRTWGADQLSATLDAAQKRGIRVAAGIWLGHERHGFRYSDPAQIERQKEEVRRVVLAHRDHPALLLWSLGNEMEGDGTSELIWKAVNDLAVMVKDLDPRHPVMTVIAEAPPEKVRNLHRLCPAVDIVGINAYGGAATLGERYARAGGRKPFILTEFGPLGHWEAGRTAWGAAIEATSSEKAGMYRKAWTETVQRSPLCLGGFAFLWGQKQETTATWFGMLLPDGTRLAAADVLQKLWTGAEPANRCPVIRALTPVGPAETTPGAELTVRLTASDPDGDRLSAEWTLQAEPAATGSGGDAEATPPIFPEAIVRAGVDSAVVRMPAAPRGYRLFVSVRDGKGGGATANLPLLVRNTGAIDRAPRARLPMALYAEAGDPTPYSPSGWMGGTGSIRLDPDSADRPFAGRTALRCAYLAADGWGGVVWQNPSGDWGDRPGGYDLSGARRLVWHARGARGGEVVSFLFGLLGPDKPFADTVRLKLENVTLPAEWKRYEIPLDGAALARIKTAFGWTVAGQGRPVEFYLDDIRIE
ncbi:MAG: hypothetical protein HUU17_12645 [Chthonomonadales bacterium]|nr:hypothetical protein [Chthonomonadales bacterium]